MCPWPVPARQPWWQNTSTQKPVNTLFVGTLSSIGTRLEENSPRPVWPSLSPQIFLALKGAWLSLPWQIAVV